MCQMCDALEAQPTPENTARIAQDMQKNCQQTVALAGLFLRYSEDLADLYRDGREDLEGLPEEERLRVLRKAEDLGLRFVADVIKMAFPEGPEELVQLIQNFGLIARAQMVEVGGGPLPFDGKEKKAGGSFDFPAVFGRNLGGLN